MRGLPTLNCVAVAGRSGARIGVQSTDLVFLNERHTKCSLPDIPGCICNKFGYYMRSCYFNMLCQQKWYAAAIVNRTKFNDAYFWATFDVFILWSIKMNYEGIKSKKNIIKVSILLNVTSTNRHSNKNNKNTCRKYDVKLCNNSNPFQFVEILHKMLPIHHISNSITIDICYNTIWWWLWTPNVRQSNKPSADVSLKIE